MPDKSPPIKRGSDFNLIPGWVRRLFEPKPVPAISLNVERLELQPGDTLVAYLPEALNLTMDQASHLSKRISDRFPGHECMVLANGIRLGAVASKPVSVSVAVDNSGELVARRVAGKADSRRYWKR